MNCSIFIRTYAKDSAWLSYCLRSIRKFAVGFSEVVVVYPATDPMPPLFPDVKYHPVKEFARGYIAQQIDKMYADTFTDAEYILYIDSDCICTELFSPDRFMKDGKIRLLKRRWEDVGDAVCWREPTQRALKHSEFETMACFPIMHSRKLLQRTRLGMQVMHMMRCNDYFASQQAISEFNILGNEALNDPDYIADFANPAEDGYPRICKQHWSHGGISPQMKAEFEEILVNG